MKELDFPVEEMKIELEMVWKWRNRMEIFKVSIRPKFFYVLELGSS